MSDAVANTNPLAKGLSTSEGQLTLASTIAGLLLVVLGALQPLLLKAQENFPAKAWIGMAAMACGAVISAAALLGYNKGRSLVKSTQLDGLIRSGVPVVVDSMFQAFMKSQGKAATITINAPASTPPGTPIVPPPPSVSSPTP